MRATLERMPRMRSCEIQWFPELGPCSAGRIQWHHPWEYGGTQINEIFALLGACPDHHDAVKTDRRVKEAFERRSLELASAEDLEKYPKFDWAGICRALGVSMPERITNETAEEKMNKAKQILVEKARELRSKALAKRREADKLDAEAAEVEAGAAKL